MVTKIHRISKKNYTGNRLKSETSGYFSGVLSGFVWLLDVFIGQAAVYWPIKISSCHATGSEKWTDDPNLKFANNLPRLNDIICKSMPSHIFVEFYTKFYCRTCKSRKLCMLNHRNSWTRSQWLRITTFQGINFTINQMADKFWILASPGLARGKV